MDISKLLPHSSSMVASQYTLKVIELQTTMITITTVGMTHSACEDDLNSRCRRISVAPSKQNMKGPKKMICQSENGPWREYWDGFVRSDAMIAVVDRYTLMKQCMVPNGRNIVCVDRERALCVWGAEKGEAEASRGRPPPAENLRRARFLFSELNLADQIKIRCFPSDPSEYGTSFRYSPCIQKGVDTIFESRKGSI